MVIRQFLERVYLARRWAVSPSYAGHLRKTVEMLDDWSGEPVRVDEFSERLLAEFLRYRLLAGDAPQSVNSRRRWLLAIWREAFEDDHAPPPKRVAKAPEPDDPPTAWTVEEIGELLWTAAHWPGQVGAVPASTFWPALFATAYWTGCRISALRRCRRSDLNGRWLTVRGQQQKNSHGQLHELPPHCLEKIGPLLETPGAMIWDWPHCPRHLWTIARKIIERAGLEAPKQGKNLFQKVRRTNISYCAVQDMAIAQRQAGHASAETTRRYYVSPRIARERSAADVLPTPEF